MQFKSSCPTSTSTLPPSYIIWIWRWGKIHIRVLMFCVASVLYQNCSTQALECINQNVVLYFARNNIPCLKSSQIELNILIVFGCFPSWYYGGQSDLHLQTVHLPNPHLPTQVYLLIEVFVYLGVVPRRVQHLDVVSILQDSELIWAEGQSY